LEFSEIGNSLENRFQITHTFVNSVGKTYFVPNS